MLPVQVLVENTSCCREPGNPSARQFGRWLLVCFLAASGLQKRSRHTKGDISSVVKVAQGMCIMFSFKS